MVEESTEDGWFLRIYGNERELEQLNEFLDSPKCRLVHLKETDEAYNLTACRFLNYDHTATSELCESAKKLLIMIKAFAKIERGLDFQFINIGFGKVDMENEKSPIIIKREGSNLRVYAFEKGVVVSKEESQVATSGAQRKQRPKREKKLHDKYLNRCDDDIDSNIFDALYYFAEETSFYSLYKVYETIKADTDGHPHIDQNCKMVDDGWVDYKDLKAFKESANCHGVVRSPEGKYSLRHAPAKCRQGKQY